LCAWRAKSVVKGSGDDDEGQRQRNSGGSKAQTKENATMEVHQWNNAGRVKPMKPIKERQNNKQLGMQWVNVKDEELTIWKMLQQTRRTRKWVREQVCEKTKRKMKA